MRARLLLSRALLLVFVADVVRWSSATGASANLGASDGVKFVSPKPGQALYGDEVVFMFRVEAPKEVLESGARVCFSVVNKRVSYFQSTQCIADVSQPFTLRGFVPGVWRARAYLVASGAEEDTHWKGGHDDILGSDDQVRFVVEPAKWRNSTMIDQLNAVFPDSEPWRDGSRDYQALVQRYPRLRALEAAGSMVADPVLGHKLAKVSLAQEDDRGLVVMLMCNQGHLALARNALSSLERVGLLQHTVVFGVTPGVCEALSPSLQGAAECVAIPQSVTAFCPHCDEVRDVWSSGFPDIAVLKPMCVLASLRLGYDVLWMDTDVVTLRSPLADLGPRADISIQAGAAHPTEVARTSEQAFRSELCTGFYRVRSTSLTRQAFKHVIFEMATHGHDDKFGDQSATNLVLFEGRFRGLPHEPVVQVLDPLLYPSGGVFFETDELQRAGIQQPAIVHNNFIFGVDNKIQRFKDRGLWFEDVARPEEGLQQCESCDLPPAPDPAVLERCLRNLSLLLSPDNDLLFHPHEGDRPQGGHNGTRVVATVSLGERPWVEPLVLPRIKDFAAKVGADLIVVRGDRCMAHGVPDFRTCAMTEKVSLLGGLLSCYDQVLLADDTALIRRDCPDLFSMVPPDTIGACLEDERVRQPREIEALVRLSCLKYNTSPCDGQWFNSGLLLLSSSLVSPAHLPRPTSTDPLLHGDQGYLNAIRHQQCWPIRDLGYAFNFVGSFEGANAPRRPLQNSSEAFIVHATTGLRDSSDDGRATFLSGIHDSWTAQGL